MCKAWSLLPEFLSHHTQGHFNENSKVQAKRIELLLILQHCRHLIPRPAGVITVCLQSTAQQTGQGSGHKCRRLASWPLFLCWCAVVASQDPVAYSPSPPPTFLLSPQGNADCPNDSSPQRSPQTPLIFCYYDTFSWESWIRIQFIFRLSVAPREFVWTTQLFFSTSLYRWLSTSWEFWKTVLCQEMENERNNLGAFSKVFICFYFLSNFLSDEGPRELTTKCLRRSGTPVPPEPDTCTFSRAARTDRQSRPFLMSRLSRSLQLPVTLNSGGQPAASLQQTCQSHLLWSFLTSEIKRVDPAL